MTSNASITSGTSVTFTASVAPVTATTDEQGQEVVVIRVHESRRNTMDIGAGLEIIPRNGNIPVGSVVVPGLHDEVAGSCPHGGDGDIDAAVAGDHHHGRIRIARQDVVQTLKAFIPRCGASDEVQIQQDRVHRLGRQHAPGLGRTARLGHAKAMSVQQQAGGLQHVHLFLGISSH